MQLLKFYLILINLLTFGLFVFDKWLSKRKRVKYRIPENRLLVACMMGGSLGAILAMSTVQHKTKNIKFVWGVPIILLLQAGVLVFIIKQLANQY